MGIRERLWLLFMVAILAVVGTSGLLLITFKENLLSERKADVKNLVDVAHGILAHYAQMSRTGRLNEAQAKKEAVLAIKKLRYGKDGYFWITDMHPNMVMHPISPQLNGKDMTEFKDPNGKHLSVEFVDMVKIHGEGFLDYLWPKPGFDQPVVKLSYVKGLADWDWIVGTGFYLDDMDAVYTRAMAKGGVVLLAVMAVMSLITALVISGIMKSQRGTARSAESIASRDLTKP